MAIKDRLIQFILRGKDEMSPEVKKATEAVDGLSQEAERLGQTLDSAKGAQGLADSLKNLRRAVEQAEGAIVQGDLQIRELREALDKAPGSEGLQQSLKDAEREARRAHKQLAVLRGELADTEQAARAAGVDTDNLADEQQRLAADVTKAKAALEANNVALRDARRAQAAASRAAAEHVSRVGAVREAMSSGARQVLAFAAAYVSLNAVMGLVQRGLSLVSQGIRAVAMEGSDKQQALGQLEATLASTGRQAEFTTKQLLDMADAFEASSMLSAEEVQSAQARLLSYTDVAANEFPRALQIVIDQQQRLGISAEQSAEIVGRALQSPSKAMAALGRQGFTLEAGQQRLLKQLEATGKMAEAQSIIMDMLTEAYGGAAAAARMNTFQGLLKGITDRFGDFASLVANSGVFEYMQRQLVDLSDYLDEMANDGRLDDIAQSLSDAFVNGAEAVSEYIKRLAEVDFEGLANSASAAARQIGPAIESTVSTGRAVVATLTTVWNAFSIAVTSSAAVLLKISQQTAGGVARAYGQIASLFGGTEVRQAADDLYQFLGELSDAYAEQAKTDLGQISDAWNSTAGQAEASADRQAKAVKRVAEKSQSYFKQIGTEIGAFFRGTITDLDQALAAIAFAETAADLDQVAAGLKKSGLGAAELNAALQALEQQRGLLGVEAGAKGAAAQVEVLRAMQRKLHDEFSAGTRTLESWQQEHNRAAGAIRQLEQSAGGATSAVSDLDDALGDLAAVQAAISNAKTAGDINAIRAALLKLYQDGAITLAQYNEELEKTNVRQRELAGAVEKTARQGKASAEQLTRSQEMYNAALEDGILTSEELRRISGQRMEEERRASGEAMERQRKGLDTTKRDMTDMENFFGKVMSDAREPLAAMSAEALEAYDRLRGISSASPSIDTSSLEATSASLGRVSQQLGEVQKALSSPLTGPLGSWMLETQQASLQTQQAFLSQKASLQSLLRSYERGDMSARSFIEQANNAKVAMGLLDDSDLSALESAIASAEQRMQQMAESTHSTLSSLQDELDGLQGRQDDIERRRFASRRRELEAQLAEAQASGDSQAVANASRSLGLLRQIESESEAQRQAEAQRARQEEQTKAKEAEEAKPAPAQAEAPSKVIRLEVPGQAPVDVAVRSTDDETKLLGILESAGLRSL